jgi:hypothetical protein
MALLAGYCRVPRPAAVMTAFLTLIARGGGGFVTRGSRLELSWGIARDIDFYSTIEADASGFDLE